MPQTTLKPPKTGGRAMRTRNATRSFSEAVVDLPAMHQEDMHRWMTTVADGDPARGLAPDPARALDFVAELAAPKLGRIEHTGEVSVWTVPRPNIEECCVPVVHRHSGGLGTAQIHVDSRRRASVVIVNCRNCDSLQCHVRYWAWHRAARVALGGRAPRVDA